MSPAEQARKVAAKIESLRKRAATGDVLAKQELARVQGIVSRAVRAQRQQNALMLAAAAAQTQIVGEEEEPGVVYAGTDRFDIADRIAKDAVEMDSLGRKVMQRNEEWQQLQQLAPFQRTNPVSILNGILGNQIILSSGEQGDVANWEGDDAESCPVTVVLGPSNGQITFNPAGGGAPTVTPMRAYAEVRFGTKGFSTLVRVDVGTGCQFTINASAVRVTLVMPAAIGALAAQQQPLTGMLSFNAPMRTTPLTYTVYHDDAIGVLGPFAYGPIPPFAKQFLIKTSAAYADAWTITVFDTTGNVIDTVTKAANSNFLTPVTLSGDAAFYSIAAVGAPLALGARVIFSLAV